MRPAPRIDDWDGPEPTPAEPVLLGEAIRRAYPDAGPSNSGRGYCVMGALAHYADLCERQNYPSTPQGEHMLEHFGVSCPYARATDIIRLNDAGNVREAYAALTTALHHAECPHGPWFEPAAGAGLNLNGLPLAEWALTEAMETVEELVLA